jgi:hypothetical protein
MEEGTMNRNTTIEGTEETVCDACQLVPLTILALDIDEPVVGWPAFFPARGIELIEDDLGRMAIRREDVRTLIAERREWELKAAAETSRRQEETVRKSRPVLSGIPRPPNADAALTAFEVMRGTDAADEEDDPNRRVSPHEEFFRARFGAPQKVVVEEDK